MTLAKAFASPPKALFDILSMMASSLVSIRIFPFLSRTFMRLLRTSAKVVARFFEPFGRPLGLPDWPGLNCRLTGGRPYPTAPFCLLPDRFDSLIVELHYRPVRAKRLWAFFVR